MSDRVKRLLLLNATAAVVAVTVLFGVDSWRRSAGSLVQPLPLLGQVPDFTLRERSGSAVSLNDLKGKVWISDFVFTHCAGPCPMLTAQMAKLQQPLEEFPDVRLVSFTVDPERDTPEVLTTYAEQFGAGDRWHFLTGEKAPMYSLIVDGFKLGLDDGSALTAGVPGPGTITHTVRFVLVDRQGQIRGYYDGTDSGLQEKLLPDVRQLLRQ